MIIPYGLIYNEIITLGIVILYFVVQWYVDMEKSENVIILFMYNILFCGARKMTLSEEMKKEIQTIASPEDLEFLGIPLNDDYYSDHENPSYIPLRNEISSHMQR